MFELLSFPNQSPPVVGYRLSGDISGMKVPLLLDAIKRAGSRHPSVNLLGEIVDIDELDQLDGILRQFAREFKSVERVGKYAVVTDKKLLRAIASVENAFIPVAEVRAFPFSQRKAALNWLGSAADSLRPVVSVVSFRSAGNVGIRVHGRLKAGDLKDIERLVAYHLVGTAQFNFYVEVADAGGRRPDQVWADIRVAIPDARVLRRVVLVVDQLHDAPGAKASFGTAGVDLRVFAKADLDKARQWLTDGRASTVSHW